MEFLLPAQAGPPKARFPGPRSDNFSVSPRRENPQPLWVSCAGAQTHSQ